MFYVVLDNNLITQDKKEILTKFYSDVKELANITNEEYHKNIDKYKLINGILINISNTDEYKSKISEEKKSTQKTKLQSKIDELDKKRIRAIAEPELKDIESGKTWLEYYTEQILSLRTQISAL